MAKEQETIISQDGLRLQSTSWKPDDPEAVICLIHGFGEHIGRYEHVAQFLNENRIALVGMDIRGHGHSEGLKGHAPSMSMLMSDIEELLKLARRSYNDLPMFLFGHSMGGNLVLNFGIRKKTRELAGIIASSPWIRLAFSPPAWKLKAGAFFSKVMPKYREKNGLHPDHLSKDKAVGEAYLADPLVNFKISAGLFKLISDGGEYIMNNHRSLEIPTLVYHGSADQIISYDTNKNLFENSDVADWQGWDGVRHEPHNDIEKPEVMDFLAKWIIKRA